MVIRPLNVKCYYNDDDYDIVLQVPYADYFYQDLCTSAVSGGKDP